MLQLRLIDKIVRPRHENGVDYGNKRSVIAKIGKRELIWRHGNSRRKTVVSEAV